MPQFEVKTTSTFDLIYLVEAETKEQAVEFALDCDNDQSYYVQKHMGERHTDVVEIPEIYITDWVEAQSKRGFV